MKKILALVLALLMAACALPAMAEAAPVEVTILLNGNNAPTTRRYRAAQRLLAEKIGVTRQARVGTWSNFKAAERPEQRQR